MLKGHVLVVELFFELLAKLVACCRCCSLFPALLSPPCNPLSHLHLCLSYPRAYVTANKFSNFEPYSVDLQWGRRV